MTARPSAAERYAAARRRQAASRTELARFRDQLDFALDDFQGEACQALERGEGVLVAAPTGAGKTVVGEFAVHLGLARGLKTFYTTPIKALSNQKYTDLSARYGQQAVGLLTGDTAINPHAEVVVMTTEVLRNMLYSGSRDLERLGYVVMDEVHYLADRFRGPVWEEVILHLAAEVQVVSLSATVSNAEEFGQWLGEVRGRTAVIVSEHRPVPLTQHMMVGPDLFDLYSASAAAQADRAQDGAPDPVNPDLLDALRRARRAAAGTSKGHSRRGPAGTRKVRLRPPARSAVVRTLQDADLLPAIVFVFSRAGCEQAVSQVVAGGVDLTTDEQARRIRAVIDRRTADVPMGDLGVLGFHAWSYALQRGVAAHHAGMLPVFKETVEELFSAGLVKVVYATETLALGINMPARTVVLESLRKWNGTAHVTLTPGEYTQLTGRAGRRGIDVRGHAVVLAADTLAPETVSSLASRRTYPLESAFRPTYNMAVNLLQRTTRLRAREILETSFAQFQADRGVVKLASQARAARRKLAGLEEKMTCHLGDFREYIRLRARITAAQDELSHLKRAQRHRAASRQMESLEPGAVIIVRRGRRHRHAVVLESGADRSGNAVVTVLGEDSRIVTITPDTTPEGAHLVGSIDLGPHTDMHRPRDRERLVDRLIEAVRSGELTEEPARRLQDSAEAQTLSARIEDLRRQMRMHPCHACPDREEHAGHGRAWLKASSRSENLQRRIETRTGTIARLFDSVCSVLTSLGYLEAAGEDLSVTSAGRLLARVYAERDLLIAQCTRQGVWEGLGPADLAAAVSACVYEPRTPGPGLSASVSGGSGLAAALGRTLAVSRQLADTERLAGLEASTDAEPALAPSVRAWARGADLAQVLSDAELSAGDFVRWCKQLLDVLGQLAALSRDLDDGADLPDPARGVSLAAHTAATRVSRGVVAWSGL